MNKTPQINKANMKRNSLFIIIDYLSLRRTPIEDLTEKFPNHPFKKTTVDLPREQDSLYESQAIFLL